MWHDLGLKRSKVSSAQPLVFIQIIRSVTRFLFYAAEILVGEWNRLSCCDVSDHVIDESRAESERSWRLLPRLSVPSTTSFEALQSHTVVVVTSPAAVGFLQPGWLVLRDNLGGFDPPGSCSHPDLYSITITVYNFIHASRMIVEAETIKLKQQILNEDNKQTT